MQTLFFPRNLALLPICLVVARKSCRKEHVSEVHRGKDPRSTNFGRLSNGCFNARDKQPLSVLELAVKSENLAPQSQPYL